MRSTRSPSECALPSFPLSRWPLAGLDSCDSMAFARLSAGDLADDVADGERAEHALAGVGLDVRGGLIVDLGQALFRLLDLRPYALFDLARGVLQFTCHFHDPVLRLFR